MDDEIDRLIQELKESGPEARPRLLERLLYLVAYPRLRALSATMLNEKFGRLKQVPDNQTTNIVDELMERLRDAVTKERVEFQDAKHFFCLASQHVRWVLLERVRELAEFDPRHLLPQDQYRTPPPLWLKLDRCIEALLEPLRDVIKLRFWDGLTVAQIATQLELSPRGVEERLVRALLALKECVGEELPPMDVS